MNDTRLKLIELAMRLIDEKYVFTINGKERALERTQDDLYELVKMLKYEDFRGVKD